MNWCRAIPCRAPLLVNYPDYYTFPFIKETDVLNNTNPNLIDPDAFGNGFSGPSKQTGGAGVAKINNNANPTGGPSTCLWSVNNCGPNDEPFSFHGGGVNVTMGDGSVRFIKDTINARTLKYAIGATDGQIISLDE